MANTFSAQVTTLQPTTIGPGVRLAKVAASFSGTQSTLDIISPFASVVDAFANPVTQNTVSTTRTEAPLLTNTINGSGMITLIAASTNPYDVILPTILRFSRAGTNNQDLVVSVFGT